MQRILATPILFTLSVFAAVSAAPSPLAGQTSRVSLDNAGLEGTGASNTADISWDGRYVAFESISDLAPGFKTHGSHSNIFVRDRESGTTFTVDQPEVGGSNWGDSRYPSISANGRWISFFSEANLRATPGWGIFLHDRDPDENGVYDEGNGSLTLVSVRQNGDPAAWVGLKAKISSNGRWVTFHSEDPDIVGGDTNLSHDVFLYDRLTANMRVASIDTSGALGSADSWDGDLSHDGRFVSFTSAADNFAPHQANHNIYLRDRDPDGNGVLDEGNGTIQLVSQSTAGVFGNHDSDLSRISADGNRIIFQSVATTLVLGLIYSDVRIYMREISTGVTIMASVNNAGESSSTHSYNPDISPDGRFVTFQSQSSNLVGGDANGVQDIFMRDLTAGMTSLISMNTAGVWGDSHSYFPAISAGATSVAFSSMATNFDPADTNGVMDVFAKDGGSSGTKWLHVGLLKRNATAEVDAYGFDPGERVYLIRGLGGIGAGQCPPQLGGLCLDLLDPITLQKSALADSFGHVDFQDHVPAAAPLIEVYFQAVAPRGLGGIDSVKSSTVAAWIQN
jgi:Tol biopolymer transport system component